MDITKELINLSARVLLAKSSSELLEISAALNSLAQSTLRIERNEEQEKRTTGFLKFTKEEISKMPTTFKKEFIANGCVAHIIKRPSGKTSFCYEIRYRRNGYNLSVSSTSLETAKKKFIDKTLSITPKSSYSQNFAVLDLTRDWLAIREKYISTATFKGYSSLINRFILPHIADREVAEIKTVDLLPIMAHAEGKGRLYEDLRSVLNQLFEYAVKNNYLPKNPVALIEFRRSERTHGTDLTPEEIHKLLTESQEPIFLLQLFGGLRPCEARTAQVKDGFIISVNAKRKKGKVEYKKIPLHIEAEIFDLAPKKRSKKWLEDEFKRLFPNRTQYHLRHTFSTICQQYVRREIVETWMGDSTRSIIGNTYTHFSDEFMIEEMKKVHFVPQNVPQSVPKL